MSHAVEFPPPRDWQVFEDLCHALFQAEWEDPETQKNGRPGQKQHGVDIFGRRNGCWQAAQCKRRQTFPEKELTEKEVRTEVEAARGFASAHGLSQPLETLVIATTAPPSADLLALAARITEEHGDSGPRVTVYGWNELCERAQRHPEVLRFWERTLLAPQSTFGSRDGQTPGAGSLEAATPTDNRPGKIDFGRFVTEKTKDFVGRQWLFDRIETFREQHPRGYFLLHGDPGIGKSSLVAELVRRHGYVHHFNIRAEGINRAEDFLANICTQLIAIYRPQNTFLPQEATKDGRFFKNLLEDIAGNCPDEAIVLVVDALDEAVPVRDGVNPLYLPLTIPRGVYIVATSRRGTHLRTDCEIEVLDLEQDQAGNLADIRAFVEGHLKRPGIHAYATAQNLTDEDFVEKMVRKSQGNFMYLRYVLPEIEGGAYRDQELDTLPEGLEGYYQDHWQRMRSQKGSDWFDYQLPVLVALTAVKEPVPFDLIVNFSGVSDRRRIRGVLADWDAFIYKDRIEDGEAESRQKRYRLYHDSFHDFIAAKDEVADEQIDLKAAHGNISDVLLREFYDEPVDLRSNSNDVPFTTANPRTEGPRDS